MLFNSYPFIFVFLPIALCGFFLLARKSRTYAALWLAVASVFFYGWWDPRFVALLLGSIGFNYFVGARIASAEPGSAKGVLIAGIVVDLVLLAFFKYCNFFISIANELGLPIEVARIVLPAGISFFTFTQIAFLVDCHRGLVKEYRFSHYVLFVSWFPHLISGPVLHHKQMMPQFAQARTYVPSVESVSVGLTMFIFGLFKKVMIADQFALYSKPFFWSVVQGDTPMLVESWVGVLAYSFQLYFDFSGYSDMAIGLSRMFNVKLPLNFNSPYKARDIIDFWRRWHMTLSAFLRDYLYVPLGGNRKGAVRRYVNLMITMLLGGLWHGAGWSFLLWGGIHGAYLVVNHGFRWAVGVRDGQAVAGGAIVGTVVTFLAVTLAWVPFRAESISGSISIWRGMSGLNGVRLPSGLAKLLGDALSAIGVNWNVAVAAPSQVYVASAWLLAGFVIVWLMPNTQELLADHEPAWDRVSSRSRLRWVIRARSGVIAGILFAASVLFMSRSSEFLYFQF